jgi:hypothetical protein
MDMQQVVEGQDNYANKLSNAKLLELTAIVNRIIDETVEDRAQRIVMKLIIFEEWTIEYVADISGIESELIESLSDQLTPLVQSKVSNFCYELGVS